ncbi:hypothetical protein AMS68_000919 [Peltaster fructicola]|uniref:DUF1275 domain protein n=1 Tax=Peltaster fructicola TaxID=286661 RepID=A0A6H0XKY3_9PEZI|nr:hypothetical protein AMS68_000919 [Peltaster fructicola]
MNTPVKGRSDPPMPGFLPRELSYRLEKETHLPRARPDLQRVDSTPGSDKLSVPRVGHISPLRIPTVAAWKLYLTQEVAFDWYLAAQMYVLTLATGVLDVTTYNTYRVFASKMTGNMLLLAVDAVNHSALSQALEQNVATAICAFIIGAAAFGHIGRLIGRRRRLYLLATNLLQTALILAAGAIQHYGVKSEVGHHAVIKMFLLAFAMAGQVSLAIGVGLAELNTTMITSTLIQLCYDPDLFKLNNRPRTRRLGFFLTMAAGHFAGAAASKRGASLGILLTACIKALVTLSFLFNPGMVMPSASDVESNSKSKDGAVTPVVQVLWGD